MIKVKNQYIKKTWAFVFNKIRERLSKNEASLGIIGEQTDLETIFFFKSFVPPPPQKKKIGISDRFQRIFRWWKLGISGQSFFENIKT